MFNLREHLTFIEGEAKRGSSDGVQLNGYYNKRKESVTISSRFFGGLENQAKTFGVELTEKIAGSKLEQSYPGLLAHLKTLAGEDSITDPAMLFITTCNDILAENSEDTVTRDPAKMLVKLAGKLVAAFAGTGTITEGESAFRSAVSLLNYSEVSAEASKILAKNGRDEEGYIRLKAPRKDKEETAQD